MLNKKFISQPKRLPYGVQDANLTCVLLSAGNALDKRFKRSVGLIEFKDGRKLIDCQIQAFRKNFPMAEIIVVTGYDADNLIKHIHQVWPMVRIVENERFEETNNSRSLYLASLVGKSTNYIIANGDIYFDSTAIQDIVSKESVLLMDSGGTINSDEVGVTVIGNLVTYVAHGLDKKWSQILFAKDTNLTHIINMCSDRNNNRRYLYEIINDLIDCGCKFGVKEHTGVIKEFDSIKDLETFNENFVSV